jgi:hypothetical protein
VHQISSFTPFVARAEGWVQKKHGMFITSWHSCWCVVGADAVYLFESVALARKFCSCAPRRLISMPTPLLEALALDYICLKNGKVSGVVDIDGMPCGLEIFAPARRSQSFELIGTRFSSILLSVLMIEHVHFWQPKRVRRPIRSCSDWDKPSTRPTADK